jgi:hypothetical protein
VRWLIGNDLHDDDDDDDDDDDNKNNDFVGLTAVSVVVRYDTFLCEVI